MGNTAVPPKELRFGPFELHFEGERLLRNGTGVKLQDQPLKLLLLLAEQPGRVVSRNEMRMRLWPAEAYGDFDNGLNVAIKKLRTALGDDSECPSYIETIPRRGYRFIAPVSEELLPKSDIPAGTETRSGNDATDESENQTGLTESGLEIAPFGVRQPLLTRRILWMAVASTLILTGASLVAFSVHRRNSTESFIKEMKNSTTRRAVAVLDFRNSSGRADDAWLSTAFSQMLSTELAAGDRLRLVPGEDVAQANMARPSINE